MEDKPVTITIPMVIDEHGDLDIHPDFIEPLTAEKRKAMEDFRDQCTMLTYQEMLDLRNSVNNRFASEEDLGSFEYDPNEKPTLTAYGKWPPKGDFKHSIETK